jgi:hypothetical protein
MRVRECLEAGLREHALELLSGTSFPEDDRVELLVTRGELHVRQGATGRAIVDFSSALALGATDELEARALYGRAISRAVIGQSEASENDLARYALKHPNGAHIQAVRALRGGTL